MSSRKGEIETGYVMVRGRDKDLLCHGEGGIETGYAMERGRDRDRLCQGDRER